MSSLIARKALDMLSKSSLPISNVGMEQASLGQLLSDREKEILQYTVEGYSPKQIADVLHISIFTVRRHISNIYEKLHVNTNTQIMSLAYKNKWI